MNQSLNLYLTTSYKNNYCSRVNHKIANNISGSTQQKYSQLITGKPGRHACTFQIVNFISELLRDLDFFNWLMQVMQLMSSRLDA